MQGFWGFFLRKMCFFQVIGATNGKIRPKRPVIGKRNARTAMVFQMPSQNRTFAKKQIPMRILCSLLLLIFCWNCSPQKTANDRPATQALVRFDSALYRYLTQQEPADSLLRHRPFLDLYGEKVLGIGRSDSAGFYDRLRHYFAEPTLMQIYRDEQQCMANLSALTSELSTAQKLLQKHFPELPLPTIYLHVSGWGQNVIVDESFLSLSADKYLGENYALYGDFFYPYQRQRMTPECMATDYLLGFLMAAFPFQGNEAVLLDRMIYEGKLRYLLSRLLPRRQPFEWTGYTAQQYAWCEQHCARIWKTILEQQQLFTPDYATTAAYLQDAPFTSTLTADSPGRVGIWLGFRIVQAYMRQRPRTEWQALMQHADPVAFLKEARFRPEE
jgi:hypothetical protein